jgi:plasmid stabilization system protein ParE
MQVTFAELALSDIEDIRRQFANDDPLAAGRVAATIVVAADWLVTIPRLGRLGSTPGTFELAVRPYVFVGEVHRAKAVILRVWHSRYRRPKTKSS